MGSVCEVLLEKPRREVKKVEQHITYDGLYSDCRRFIWD